MLYYHPHQPFGDGFEADNDTQAGFFDQFTEFLTTEPPLNSEQLLNGIREAMSASYFVHPDIVKKLPIYQKIIVFLKRYNITVPITKESGRLPARRLVCRIWNSAEYTEDRSRALRIYDNIRSGYYMVLSSPFGSSSVMRNVFRTQRCGNGHDLRRNPCRSSLLSSRSLAKSIAERFGSEALKIGGQGEERWDHYLDNSVRATREMELKNGLKTKDSQHILRHHALDFYREFDHGKANSWGEVLRMVGDEVNSNIGNEAFDRKFHRVLARE